MARKAAGKAREASGKAAAGRSARSPKDGEVVDIDALRPDPENRRMHGERNLDMIGTALDTVGPARSIVIDESNVIHAGNGVIEAAKARGKRRIRIIDADGEEIIAVRRSNLTPEQWRALAMYDNRAGELAEWNPGQLAKDQAEGLDLAPYFSEEELAAIHSLPGGASRGGGSASTLVERFGVPPFSVLDARQGYWQDRKRAWLSLGIESELGRGAGVHQYSEAATIKRQGGTLGHDGSKVLQSRQKLVPGGGSPMPVDRDKSAKRRHLVPGAKGDHPSAAMPLDRAKRKLSPGGSPRPAMKLGANGRTQRGDGRGKVIPS